MKYLLSTCVFSVLLCSTPIMSFASNWTISGSNPLISSCDFKLPLDVFISSEKLATASEYCFLTLKISGQLDEGDKYKIEKVLDFFKKDGGSEKIAFIRLNSEGGSVLAALALASEIRRPGSPFYNAYTSVREEDICYSACTVVLSAGFSRNSWGRVGIHRPKFLPGEIDTLGYETLKEAYDFVYTQIDKIFERSNIHPSLIEDMWSIPSYSIEILSHEDLKKYRLLGDDLVHREKKEIDGCKSSDKDLYKDFISSVDTMCTPDFVKIAHKGSMKSCIEGMLGVSMYSMCGKTSYTNQ